MPEPTPRERAAALRAGADALAEAQGCLRRAEEHLRNGGMTQILPYMGPHRRFFLGVARNAREHAQRLEAADAD